MPRPLPDYYVVAFTAEENELDHQPGYSIKDRNNDSFHLYQPEPYIPYRVKREDGTTDYEASGQKHLEYDFSDVTPEPTELERINTKLSNLEKQNASLIMSDAKNAKVIDGLKSQNANLMLSDAQKTKEINTLKEKIATLEEGAPTV